MTKILFCACAHAYQDKRYGAGKRVHNLVPVSKDMPAQWRCTVCGTAKTG
jgi:rubredoxin